MSTGLVSPLDTCSGGAIIQPSAVFSFLGYDDKVRVQIKMQCCCATVAHTQECEIDLHACAEVCHAAGCVCRPKKLYACIRDNGATTYEHREHYFDLQPATTLLHTAPYQSHSHTKTVELMFPDGGQLDMAVYHRNPGSQGSRHFFVEMETPVVRSLSTGDRPTFNFHYIVIYIVAMAITAL